MNKVKLMSESTLQDVEYITEQNEDGSKKNYKIKGVFMQADIKNKNGQRVSYGDTSKKRSKDITKNLSMRKEAYGELGHPEGPTVNLERVHLI